MAFQNVTFPDIKLKHGISKSVLDPVVITGNGAREVRRRQNRWPRYTWTYPARVMQESDRAAISNFLATVHTAQDSFKLRDPVQPTITNGKLASRSGATWYLNVPISSSVAGTHPIMNPDMSALTFYKNGVPTAATFGGLDADGLPYVTVTSTSPSDTVTISGDLYLTVRFQGDLAWTIAAMTLPSGGDCTDVAPSVVELADFALVEVFEV